ncbi:lytic transglycosylase domain-containing protein [Sphingosinicella sp. GR2756]|uniref:Lytic transglycosylase domain-containing protein n=1 Tax=Sphingosinicella rhizophila TaxID=3050082 RepID=A0ABU3QAS1_9SPHN|nr:lytic transglycosylase domain-containing protein [Sphingosinicella sp. GR2756]MDT9600417.1 lytic transglycosylase domain-containing protein [Sphingosinicella sp. GR2756]
MASVPGAFSATDPYATYIEEASRRFGIPQAWIRAVMRVESAGNPSATSRAGAMGLMQVMPGTFAELRARYGLGANPYSPRDSILAGTAYLREMHDRYGSAGFLAAYNAGPGRWEDHVYRRRPLPAETVVYMARLAPLVGGSAAPNAAAIARADLHGVTRATATSWTQSALFVRMGESKAAARPDAADMQSSSGAVAATVDASASTSPRPGWVASSPTHSILAVTRPQ